MRWLDVCTYYRDGGSTHIAVIKNVESEKDFHVYHDNGAGKLSGYYLWRDDRPVPAGCLELAKKVLKD